MERIEEEIFERSLYLEVKDPYAAALAIMEAARHVGRVKEKVNKFLTSGPRQKFELSFSLADTIDRYSRAFFLFEIGGELPPNSVKISVKGTFQVRLPTRAGFVKEVFSEYYMRKLMPQSREIAKQKAAMVEKEMLNVIDYVVKA